MAQRATLAGTAVVAALTVLDITDHAVLVWPESTAHHSMTERAHSRHGQLTAGPLPDGGRRVAARLPSA